jgi:hypothetical protein
VFCPQCVLCGSRNKQRLFLYIALIGWFLRPRQCLLRGRNWVFKSGRYSFVLKGLNKYSHVPDFAAFQETCRILQSPQVHYRVHNSPLPFSIVSHMNTVSAPPSHFLKIHFNIILSTQGLRSGFSPSGFSTKTPRAPRLSRTRATSPAHLILDFITLIIFDEECQTCISSLHYHLQSPVTSSVLSPNIFNTQRNYSAKDNANGQKRSHGENFRFGASQVQVALIKS